jgi:hypothetical protein
MKLEFKKDIANFFAEACVWDNSRPTRNFCPSFGNVLNFLLSDEAMAGLDGNSFNLDVEHNGKTTNIIGKFKIADNKVMATFEAFGKTAEKYKQLLIKGFRYLRWSDDVDKYDKCLDFIKNNIK